ncbi:MAG: IclR family transcriptional regulator [Ancrocorticia sp.]|uniref:IclR family transcriptional regulator n=1 Tax=Ancrocorticia sp. TaxID=2593684 RepID=UPI003F8FA3B9
MSTTMPETGVRTVKSASRTIELLEYLASRQADPAHLSEICNALHAPRSSIYALLRTLIDKGWVQLDSTEGYSLGIRVLIAGTSYIDSDPFVRVVRPILTDLASAHNETFHMGRIDGSQVVYLVTQEAPQDLRAYSRVGRRLPAAATGLGKAILSQRPDLFPHTLRPLTRYTITTPEALQEDLERAQTQTFATENQENTLGIRCVGFPLPYTVPIRDSISCSIPIERWSEERQAEIVEGMRAAVNRIAQSAPLVGQLMSSDITS